MELETLILVTVAFNVLITMLLSGCLGNRGKTLGAQVRVHSGHSCEIEPEHMKIMKLQEELTRYKERVSSLQSDLLLLQTVVENKKAYFCPSGTVWHSKSDCAECRSRGHVQERRPCKFCVKFGKRDFEIDQSG